MTPDRNRYAENKLRDAECLSAQAEGYPGLPPEVRDALSLMRRAIDAQCDATRTVIRELGGTDVDELLQRQLLRESTDRTAWRAS